MSNRQLDINDDEIRIISSNGNEPPRKKRKTVWIYGGICCAIVLLIGMVAIAMCSRSENEATDEEPLTEQPSQPSAGLQQANDTIRTAKGYTTARDTTVNGIGLSILTPINATPTLEIGNAVLTDSTAILVAQAADVRRDNGNIVGAYVAKGELLSKGEAKAGFCSIINGELTVGVADATPMLEQALASDGYFFRQYPLVVGGQLVENKPKGKAVRKALAEISGKACIVISKERLTFHEFSQALIDAGVQNAIYLVGSAQSPGYYVDGQRRKFAFGSLYYSKAPYVNYIVWR